MKVRLVSVKTKIQVYLRSFRYFLICSGWLFVFKTLILKTGKIGKVKVNIKMNEK